jgi:hypothetical protein
MLLTLGRSRSRNHNRDQQIIRRPFVVFVIPIRCEGELLKGDVLAVLWLMFERNWY